MLWQDMLTREKIYRPTLKEILKKLNSTINTDIDDNN